MCKRDRRCACEILGEREKERGIQEYWYNLYTCIALSLVVGECSPSYYNLYEHGVKKFCLYEHNHCSAKYLNSPASGPRYYYLLCTFATVEWLITLGKAINNQSAASVEMIAFCTLPQRWGPLLTWVLSWQCYFLEGNCRFRSLREPDWE